MEAEADMTRTMDLGPGGGGGHQEGERACGRFRGQVETIDTSRRCGSIMGKQGMNMHGCKAAEKLHISSTAQQGEHVVSEEV